MNYKRAIICAMSVCFGASLALAQSQSGMSDSEKQELLKQLQELKQDQQKLQQSQDDLDRRIADLEQKLGGPAAPTAHAMRGVGKIQFNGTLQGQYYVNSSSSNSAFNSTGHRNYNTFKMRRAELKFTGMLSPQADWTVMFDPAKSTKDVLTKDSSGNVTSSTPNQTTNPLQDMFLTYHFTPNVRVDVGQEKIPLSSEGLQASNSLDVIEKALFISQGKLADVRDTGLQVKADWNQVHGTVAVLNGEGENQNNLSGAPQKAIGGRVTFTPLNSNLTVGADALSERAATGFEHERLGADVQYKNDKLTVRSEYEAALGEYSPTLGTTSGAFGSASLDNKRGYGWYGHVGYKLTPKFELVARYDTFNPDRSSSTNREEDWLGGFNYFLANNARLQFNYIHKMFHNGTPIDNVFLAQFQLTW